MIAMMKMDNSVNMTKQQQVDEQYFNWLHDICTKGMFAETISVRELLKCLHSIEFTYLLEMDGNRAVDGMQLRYAFEKESDIRDAALYLNSPCSVLEMMVALAVRMERSIMTDTRYGDRTQQWFWGMVNSLGLKGQWNDGFDEQLIREHISVFLNRKYSPDGSGGLFTVKNTQTDFRDIEIWAQMNRYICSI